MTLDIEDVKGLIRTALDIFDVKCVLIKGSTEMQKYRCTVCNYIYDPAVGDPDNGVQPGTAFEDIPDAWVCPICGVGKDKFVKEG